MAVPIFVFNTMTRRSSISANDTQITTTSTVPIVRNLVCTRGLFGMIGGNPRGFAVNTSWPVYSKKSETPIAVISTVSFGRLRNGRYARNSIVAPSTAQTDIEIRNTRIVDSILPTGKKWFTQLVAAKYPTYDPIMNTSPCAKLINRSTP